MSDPKLIDAAASDDLVPLDDVSYASPPDPVMAITVALAGELQHVYADQPQKLQAATRTLRAAHLGQQH